MGFISNEERNRQIKKLDKGNSGRKLIIIITIIVGIVCAVYILLGLLGQAGYMKTINLGFYDGDKNKFTVYGIIALVLVGIELVFGVIALIATFTLMSTKKAANMTTALARSALPGKRTQGKSAAAVTKDRVTTR